jgi:quinol monooxygenase YgiN
MRTGGLTRTVQLETSTLSSSADHQDKNMPATIVKIKVKPGREADFETVIQRLIAATNANEPGVLYYQGFRTGTTGEYYMVESYTDLDALKAHPASPHFQANRQALGECFDGPPDVQRLSDL